VTGLGPAANLDRMDQNELQSLLKRFIYDPWNDGDIDALDDVVGNGYRVNDELTVDDLKAYIREARTGFPDLTITEDDVVATDDKVAYRWTMRGTHHGEFEGIPATGKSVTGTGITFLTLADGRIVDDRFESGSPSPAEQLTGESAG
jgi:steroid delta-isomerase-like uncharacterized protein